MDLCTISQNVQEISEQFGANRRDRQIRRHLLQADFDLLVEAGFFRASIPEMYGGHWDDLPRSTRQVSDMVRVLAQGDPSVALVASMYPTVLYTVGWLDPSPIAPGPGLYDDVRAWEEQRAWAFSTANDGAWWGTITSEPGSGGDMANTRATAEPTGSPDRFLLSGHKHFGSGSGMASYMITTGVVEGDSEFSWFYMDMRDVPWDGSAGVTLSLPWDGHGMTATQSHGMTFENFPVTRVVPRPITAADDVTPPRGLVPSAFAAVNVGVVQKAMELARVQLGRRHSTLRAYEQVEWTRAEMESWLIEQSYEGMLRAVETRGGDGTLVGMKSIAELSETLLGRLCKILGGGTYARQSPFGFWLQDVRALGFLRPPWGFAFDTMYADAVNRAVLQQEIPVVATATVAAD